MSLISLLLTVTAARSGALTLLITAAALLARIAIHLVLAARARTARRAGAGRTRIIRRTVRSDARADRQIHLFGHPGQFGHVLLQLLMPLLGQFRSTSDRLMPDHRKVGHAREILRDCDGVGQVENHVPPAGERRMVLLVVHRLSFFLFNDY